VTGVDACEASQRELQRAQRMEAVGRLAGGVAHDFNNVLTAITGFAGLLRGSLPAGDGRRDDVDDILGAASRATNLTQQLLAVAKGGLIEPRVLSLSQQVVATERMLQQIVGDGIELEIDAGEHPCPVLLDPGELDRLLLNLVVNARDAMPAGGTVRVAVRRTSAEHGDAACCVLQVTDTGGGIDEALIDHVFEPFVTTEGNRGTGLGLATCFGIVERAGGDIRVRSEAGRGTELTVRLPLTNLHDSLAPDDEAPVEPARARAVVLLVEDEAPISRLVPRRFRPPTRGIGSGRGCPRSAESRARAARRKSSCVTR
jgi:signal transduction histidine kinase